MFLLLGPASDPVSRGPGVRHREADVRLEGGGDELRVQDEGEEGEAAALHRRAHLPGELPRLRRRKLHRARPLLQRRQGLQRRLGRKRMR